jgi:predicted nuclease with TOPRIM domain
MGETDLSAVIDRLDELEAQNRRLREENEQLRERVDDLEDDVDEHDDRLDDVDDRVDAVDKKRQYLMEDVVELESRLEEGDLADDADAGAAPDVPRETPLENLVALPEDVAEQSLSKQDKRARFIAMDAGDYGDKCFDGRIITAGRIGRTLAAGLDVDPHPEKVRRVMKRLNELGKDSTKLRKKNGEKRINIDEAAVDRLERHAEMDHADHDVVSRGEA